MPASNVIDSYLVWYGMGTRYTLTKAAVKLSNIVGSTYC